MTPTEVFKLFLKEGLMPNERQAFLKELKYRVYNRDIVFYKPIRWNDNPISILEMNKKYVERFIQETWCFYAPFGEYHTCSSLSSFMRYLLKAFPNITGNSRNRNTYLERENIKDFGKLGYKTYWDKRFIKKWHDFLKKYIENGDVIFFSMFKIPIYRLKTNIES